MKTPTALVMADGTGGHIFPGLTHRLHGLSDHAFGLLCFDSRPFQFVIRLGVHGWCLTTLVLRIGPNGKIIDDVLPDGIIA